MGPKLDNKNMLNPFKNTFITGVQTLWVTQHTASLRVDDAISTLLSIFETLSIFLPFCFTMW